MSTKTYIGIDYGLGRSNIDKETGIRFGVISQRSINPDAFDDVWQNARDLSYENAVAQFRLRIGACDNDVALESVLKDFGISKRRISHIGDLTNSDELTAGTVDEIWDQVSDSFNDSYCDNGERDWLYESEGYKLTNCLSTDVMVLASPFFTYAQYCSPCVPGACNLDSPLELPWHNGANKAYCLGHDYFEGGRAPYPVYSVATGELVAPAE